MGLENLIMTDGFTCDPPNLHKKPHVKDVNGSISVILDKYGIKRCEYP